MVSVRSAVARRRLVAFGDSWTYGSELMDPDIPANRGDYDERNHGYRLRHAWPARLAEMLSMDECVNLGTAARSNDTILRDLKSWLATEGYLSGRTPGDSVVCVGWTSPERRDFYFDDPRRPDCPDRGWITLYPMWQHKYKHEAIDRFTEHYVQYWWNPGEYMHRYINQVHTAQMLLEGIGMRYVMFQAIYHHHEKLIGEWRDAEYVEQNRMGISDADRTIWGMVSRRAFMHKDEPTCTFHNYVLDQVGWAKQEVLFGNHPNERGHAIWAHHVMDWMECQSLL